MTVKRLSFPGMRLVAPSVCQSPNWNIDDSSNVTRAVPCTKTLKYAWNYAFTYLLCQSLIRIRLTFSFDIKIWQKSYPLSRKTLNLIKKNKTVKALTRFFFSEKSKIAFPRNDEILVVSVGQKSWPLCRKTLIFEKRA